MERKKVDKIINISLKVLFSALFVLMFITVIIIEDNKKPPEEIAAILEKQNEDRRRLAVGEPLNQNIPDPWPAEMNQTYPEIDLIDSSGKSFKLSGLKGNVIVLSFIDMSSLISQAQAGSGLVGPYGVTKEKDEYAQTFSDVLRQNIGDDFSLPHDDVFEIYVLVYAQDGKQTSVDDAEKWAAHFDLEREQGVIVAVAKKDIRGDESDKIITGYQLIDKNHILRVDSSGPEPKHNLTMSLMPLLPKLLR